MALDNRRFEVGMGRDARLVQRLLCGKEQDFTDTGL
jgi:hypothetical protein